MNNKKLYRSADSRILVGICGGLGEYLGVDPTAVRVAWILLCALGGSGFVAYVLAALLIPEAPSSGQ